MPAPNILFPFYDLVYGGANGDGPLGTVLGTPTSADYGARYTWLNMYAAGGLWLRVKKWRFTMSVHWYDPVGGTTLGDQTADFELSPIQYSNALLTLTDETDIPLHGGWYGTDGVTGLTFGQGMLAPSRYDGAGVDRGEIGTTIITPDLAGVFAGAPGVDQGVRFEQGGPDDACGVTTTLPHTYLGSFDGSRVTGFNLTLATPTDFGGAFIGAISGSATLNPSEYWPYNRDDGGGAIYSTSTGAWLRTPAYR